MEQRKDYIESQTDIIARMLKKILEKLLKLKADDINETQNFLQESICTEGPAFTIEDLLQINDQLLIATLTNKYGYNAENTKLLADILYEMKGDEVKINYRKKALILYRYYLAESSNINYEVLSRVNYLEIRNEIITSRLHTQVLSATEYR